MLKICTIFLLLGIGGSASFGQGNSIRKSNPHHNGQEILEQALIIKERIAERKLTEPRDNSHARQVNQPQRAESSEDVIYLELFSGEVIPFVVDHVKEKKAKQIVSDKEERELTDWEKFEYTSVRGHVEGEAGSSVVLVFSGGKMSGSVSIPGQNPIQVLPSQDDNYVVSEMEPASNALECGMDHTSNGGEK